MERNFHRRPLALGRARDLVFRLLHVRSIQLRLPADHDLRREQIIQLEQPQILVLAIGHLAQRKRVAITLRAPGVHAHLDADHFDARDRLLLLQRAHYFSGSGADRAGVRGEEFHQHRHPPNLRYRALNRRLPGLGNRAAKEQSGHAKYGQKPAHDYLIKIEQVDARWGCRANLVFRHYARHPWEKPCGRVRKHQRCIVDPRDAASPQLRA